MGKGTFHTSKCSLEQGSYKSYRRAAMPSLNYLNYLQKKSKNPVTLCRLA